MLTNVMVAICCASGLVMTIGVIVCWLTPENPKRIKDGESENGTQQTTQVGST